MRFCLALYGYTVYVFEVIYSKRTSKLKYFVLLQWSSYTCRTRIIKLNNFEQKKYLNSENINKMYVPAVQKLAFQSSAFSLMEFTTTMTLFITQFISDKDLTARTSRCEKECSHLEFSISCCNISTRPAQYHVRALATPLLIATHFDYTIF